MRPYFERMDPLGRLLSAKQIESMKENGAQIEAIMKLIYMSYLPDEYFEVRGGLYR